MRMYGMATYHNQRDITEVVHWKNNLYPCLFVLRHSGYAGFNRHKDSHDTVIGVAFDQPS